MANAGGAAVHAGVDYQQRVSAILLVCLHAKYDVSQLFGHTSPITPEVISYETSASIDDINVLSKERPEIYIQAKRSLSLSSSDTSEFKSVIDQFVRQHIANKQGTHIYALITSSAASRRITQDLKKILVSIQMNDSSFLNNPLSKQEKDVLKRYKTTVNVCYRTHMGEDVSDDDFIAISKKVSVLTWDVEHGMSFEKIAMVLLHANGFKMPELVWKYLIAQSVYYASQRMTVNYSGIEGILNRYKMQEVEPAQAEILINELLAPIVVDLEKLPTGKEVLLISSFTEDADLMLVECFRFDDSGQKRIHFEGEYVRWKGQDKKSKLIQRFASISAFEVFCKHDPSVISGKRIAIVPANGIEGVENSFHAEKQRKQCIKLLNNNNQLSKCLHSGKSCLTSNAYIVELDAPGLPATVGLVLENELRSLDRILGANFTEDFEKKELPNFDHGIWIASIHRGQGLVRSLEEGLEVGNKQPVVVWNDANPNSSSYSYCVKFNMADDSFKYCFLRGKIERLPKNEAEQRCQFINDRLKEEREKGDPRCLTSESWTFANKSILESISLPNEDIVEVISAEVAKYSEIIGQTYNRSENYYAPLCVVRDEESELPLCLGSFVPLLSDPFHADELIQNWREAGIEIGNVYLAVLKNDYEFDDFVRQVFKDNFTPVIDPTMHPDGAAKSGTIIKNMDTFEEEFAAYKEEIS